MNYLELTKIKERECNLAVERGTSNNDWSKLPELKVGIILLIKEVFNEGFDKAVEVMESQNSSPH